MKNKIEKIYIGVAWPYVNNLFHIGNLAGAYLPPDVFARFHKMKGNKVLMVSGSDFHGTPITIKAEKEKKKPEEIAARFHKLNKKYLKKFRVEYDLYTSTHTLNHQKVVQEMFLILLKNGFVKILETEQLYSERSQKFLQDRYIEGECPFCHYKDARGDQCEECGRVLDPLELICPISKIDKSKLIKKRTKNYFLDLSKFEKEIKKWIISKIEIRAWIKKEAMGWIKEGLRPRAITRDISYGVPLPISKIPESQRIENINNKVFYVWFEAVIGYLSAAIEYSRKIKKPNYWKEFFYVSEAKTYYFVGQDNLVFHMINWPAQLIGYDKKINLPANVFVNKFLLLEGKKMSKSRNWFIETSYLAENYPIDAIRFYLILNNPEQKEFNFTWKDFAETNNKLLVGVIGNFIHRVLTFTKKNFGSEIEISKNDLSLVIIKKTESVFKKTSSCLEKGEFRFAIREIIRFATFGNQYVDKMEIWNLVKKDKKEAKKVISNTIFLIDNLKTLIYPFVPEGSEKLSKLLRNEKTLVSKKGENRWYPSNYPKKIKFASNITPIFEKIDEGKIEIEQDKLKK